MINRILLVNDDGIDAKGLEVSEKIARTLCDDVWVVAPNRERSGSGCGLSLQDPLSLERRGEKRFAIEGTPVDCVMIALYHLMVDKKPDLIISGVNRGQNIAEDLIYSGTVAGAVQGLLSGYFSVALSQGFGMSGTRNIEWETAEHFAPKLIKTLFAARGGAGTGTGDSSDGQAFNINFPDRKVSDVEGVALTHQGRCKAPLLRMIESKDSDNRLNYRMGFNRRLFVPEENSDIHELYRGKISITPLQPNWTDRANLDRLRQDWAKIDETTRA